MGVDALGQAVLEGATIVAPGVRPADFDTPQPIAHVERPGVGAVLFLVWDKKHRFYRSLCEFFEKDQDGSWWDMSQTGFPWPWVELERPSELGEDHVEFSGRSAQIGGGKLVYALPGIAATDVQEIRCEHADGLAACPIEPTIGAFICFGELASEKKSAIVEVTTGQGTHRFTKPLPTSPDDPW
jgi:hypothetical protein